MDKNDKKEILSAIATQSKAIAALAKQITGVDKKLTGRIDDVEKNLQSEIGAVEKSLRGEIGSLSVRMDRYDTRLDGVDLRFDKLESQIGENQKMTMQGFDRMDEKIDQAEENLTGRMDSLQLKQNTDTAAAMERQDVLGMAIKSQVSKLDKRVAALERKAK